TTRSARSAPAVWWLPTRGPTRTRRRPWSPRTSASTARPPPPRRPPCTSWTRTPCPADPRLRPAPPALHLPRPRACPSRPRTRGASMQQDKHPDYHPVVFRDRAAGYAFLTRSTATSEQTIDWDDGETYPVVDVEISSESHPFYTGKARTVDTEGRIARFERRYGGEGTG